VADIITTRQDKKGCEELGVPRDEMSSLVTKVVASGEENSNRFKTACSFFGT
jgi:hypothetical protein